MTNEQTAILLKGFSNQLKTAISNAEEMLDSADVARHTEEKYIGKTPLLGRIGKMRVESDYEKVETSPVCLDDIKDVFSEIEMAILQLTMKTIKVEDSDAESI